MNKPYNQITAMLAITKASLRSILRSPSTVLFSFAFPFIFILVFGFIGGNNSLNVYNVLLTPGSDTNNILYREIKNSGVFKIVNFKSEAAYLTAKQNGKLAGEISIQKADSSYQLEFKSTTASGDKWPNVVALLQSINNNVSNTVFPNRPSYARFNFDPAKNVESIREYKMIDFILPGQLGFSLLSAAVFGVAFMFFNLRNTLVLKRFFATPISKPFIILGEALSRVIFQLITAIVIILLGHYFFGFTLVNGAKTVWDMVVLSFIGLLVFMGFGFIVSGVAKNDSSIPPFANIITLPQFLLAGTFFSIDVFPKWLQPIARAMPLTYLNDALREVAFEGHSLWDVRMQILVLLAWGVVAYFVASKLFKWE